MQVQYPEKETSSEGGGETRLVVRSSLESHASFIARQLQGHENKADVVTSKKRCGRGEKFILIGNTNPFLVSGHGAKNLADTHLSSHRIGNIDTMSITRDAYAAPHRSLRENAKHEVAILGQNHLLVKRKPVSRQKISRINVMPGSKWSIVRRREEVVHQSGKVQLTGIRRIKQKDIRVIHAIPKICSDRPKNHINRPRLKFVSKVTEVISGELIVRIQEYNVVPSRVLHTDISCQRSPSIGLMQNGHPRVNGDFIAQRARSVRRPIVHKNDLKINEALGQHAIDTIPEIQFTVIGWDNDGEKQFCYLAIFTDSASVFAVWPCEEPSHCTRSP